MKRRIIPMTAVLLLLAPGLAAGDDAPVPKEPLRELSDAQRTGWTLALVVVEKFEGGDQKGFPGIRAWRDDFRKAAKGVDPKVPPDKWPPIDIDGLVTRNPNFWRACYEIAPGDPGLMVLHAGLLLRAGEASRASYLAVIAGQRPGIPKEIKQALMMVLAHGQNAAKKPNSLVVAGIKLHDQGDYAGALKKYREALALWPQNGFAHFEVGLTLREQKAVADGEKPLPPDSVVVNSGRKNPPAVAFPATTRQAGGGSPCRAPG